MAQRSMPMTLVANITKFLIWKKVYSFYFLLIYLNLIFHFIITICVMSRVEERVVTWKKYALLDYI